MSALEDNRKEQLREMTVSTLNSCKVNRGWRTFVIPVESRAEAAYVQSLVSGLASSTYDAVAGRVAGVVNK